MTWSKSAFNLFHVSKFAYIRVMSKSGIRLTRLPRLLLCNCTLSFGVSCENGSIFVRNDKVVKYPDEVGAAAKASAPALEAGRLYNIVETYGAFPRRRQVYES